MTDTKYVTVPREPTQAQLDAMLAAAEALLISPTKKSMGSKESAHEMNAATYRAALTAAPPAASGRARELAWIEDRFGDEFATPAADQRYTVQALADGEWLALRNGERLNGEPEDVIYGTRAAGKAACQQHFNAYVRSLLALVDEAPEPKLDAPAKVAGTIFGVGVKWATVIGKAQRDYEHRDDPQPTQEDRERFAKALGRNAPAATSEAPVAWRYVRGMSSYIDQGPPPTQEEYGMFDSITPLYTHPASAGEGVTEDDRSRLRDVISYVRTWAKDEVVESLERIESALGARKGE